jgi:hypothetical protein
VCLVVVVVVDIVGVLGDRCHYYHLEGSIRCGEGEATTASATVITTASTALEVASATPAAATTTTAAMCSRLAVAPLGHVIRVINRERFVTGTVQCKM